MLFRSDRKSTRLNSSHTLISYAVFCLKKKNPSTVMTKTEPLPQRSLRLVSRHGSSHRFFFFNDTAPTETYTLPLHDAYPICEGAQVIVEPIATWVAYLMYQAKATQVRSEEHTSELQSNSHLVCRLLLEK